MTGSGLSQIDNQISNTEHKKSVEKRIDTPSTSAAS